MASQNQAEWSYAANSVKALAILSQNRVAEGLIVTRYMAGYDSRAAV
jgi:hypothetical protein